MSKKFTLKSSEQTVKAVKITMYIVVIQLDFLFGQKGINQKFMNLRK